MQETTSLKPDTTPPERQRLIIIAGPTAVGKSHTAIRLAKEIGGEIISADSMQVYRGMDVGSAKITPEEAEGIPHYLIDILDPTEEYNAARFQEMAKEKIREITNRGHVPIVCGGTGFYIEALLYDVDFSVEEETDEIRAYRKELERLLALPDETGRQRLHAMLEAVDPQSAAAIPENNVKRVMRALMYQRLHGEPISRHNEQESEKRLRGAAQAAYDCRYFVLTADRTLLYEKINRRVDQMVTEGLLEETRRLHALHLPENATARQGIGYKEMYAYLDGGCSLEEAVEQIKLHTRRFAKRQLTWFKRERDVIWIDICKGDPIHEIRKYL